MKSSGLPRLLLFFERFPTPYARVAQHVRALSGWLACAAGERTPLCRRGRPTHCLLISVVALWFGAANSQALIDEAVVAAARSVLPSDLAEGEIRAILDAGLWHEEPSAVAISIPRKNQYMTFVFRRQPDGSYSAEDVSWVARTAFGFWGFRTEEIERFETEPLRWHVNEGGHLLVQISTRGWRNGQRYIASGYFLVSADGSVSGQ